MIGVPLSLFCNDAWTTALWAPIGVGIPANEGYLLS